MRKILSIFIIFAFAFSLLATPLTAFAQTPASGGGQTATTTGTTPAPASGSSSAEQRWVIDPEVTFIGKNARRSGLLLDWTIKNYNWVCVKRVNDRQCDDRNNPIERYWSIIVFYIVVPLLLVVILATSIVIIISRGKSLTIMRFLPRFIMVILLIVFSYSLIQFLYQFTDLIQSFFLRSEISRQCPPDCISQSDLLYVGWEYETFVGLRKLGDTNAESAFMSLLLTKLTAFTYFVMIFMLLLRKIILWLFIIVSPIFPILLLFYPIRNTGKIWIGEFFRWLLYGPLFAIFLNGLVFLWKNQIPLSFDNPGIGRDMVFPTAVNILLGGPKQSVSPTNSINLTETYALYVVSLIMLWAVIIVPWILLQIFLEYASNLAPNDTAFMKTIVNMANTRQAPSGGSGGGGGGSSPAPTSPGEGTAISLPFAKRFSVPATLQPTGAAKSLTPAAAALTRSLAPNVSANQEALTAANVSLPSMRDIAKFDAAITTNDTSRQQEMGKITQALNRIASSSSLGSTSRNTIMQQSRQGNLMATSLLSAANASNRGISTIPNQKVKGMLQQMANPASATGVNREQMTKLNSMLVKESKDTSNTSKSQLASSILSVTEKTTDKEISQIKSQLSQTAQSQMSSSVSSAITQSAQASTQIQSVIKQMANPGSVGKASSRQQVFKVKSSLEKASKEGNVLAKSILSVNEKTSAEEIEALQKRIEEAKEKGEPIAAEVAALAEETTTNLPMVNRVQTVKKEDYQAVRDMWKQNYQNLEVPDGMEGNRSEWIKDDIANIDQTISLLSSQDQSKVQSGMDQVSNLLPFLLMGGFSQTEIIAYLKAKQDAAKDVSQILAADEENKIEVGTHHAEEQSHMAATIEEEKKPNPAAPATEQPLEDPMSKIEAAEEAQKKPNGTS